MIDLTLRGTWAFTRDLTLQAYLQPFVAVGDYVDDRRLARPKSYDFDAVTLAENPDFNTKSLRGIIVMRWEYKPGSTCSWSGICRRRLLAPGRVQPHA